MHPFRSSVFRLGLLLLCCGGTLANLCPPIEDLEPCGCVSDGKDVRIDCIQVTDVSSARRALQSVQGLRNVYVDFLRSRMKHVPSDLFAELHVNQVSFTNCELSSFGDENRCALEGLEDIVQEFGLHFSFPDGNELKFLNVSDLRVLRHLWIEGNDIRTLSDDWFKSGPKSLRSLYLMANFIQDLGPKAFASLSDLQVLWFTGNKVGQIQRSSFPDPALKLTTLDLTDNRLRYLPKDIFWNMPSLREVTLDENFIQQLPEALWAPVWKQLTMLYLESNPLECNSSMEWMFRTKRPFVVRGTCSAPPDRSGRTLKGLIDENFDSGEDDF